MRLTKKVINCDLSIIRFSELIDRVIQGFHGYICFTNVHMVIEAWKDKEFAKIVNNASFAVADGVPIQKALKLLYGINQERIAGMDFVPAIIDSAEQENIPIFFYGSSEYILNQIEKKVVVNYPDMRIAGMISPPYRELTLKEREEHIRIINKSGAKIVFVGLGCPKQEKWMAENTSKINAVLLGVGAAFETYSGIKRIAPEWMRIYGLEWIYRLFQDPKRLWKRYLYTNSLFLFLFLLQFVKDRIFRIK